MFVRLWNSIKKAVSLQEQVSREDLEKSFTRDIPRYYRQVLSPAQMINIIQNISVLLGLNLPQRLMVEAQKEPQLLVNILHEVAHVMAEEDYDYRGHGESFVWCEGLVFDAFKDIYIGGH